MRSPCLVKLLVHTGFYEQEDICQRTLKQTARMDQNEEPKSEALSEKSDADDAFRTERDAHLRASMKHFTKKNDVDDRPFTIHSDSSASQASNDSTDKTQDDTEKGTKKKKWWQRKKKETDATTGGPKKAQLGTLFGVYLPSVQNVFGIIMFLRLSWCVGLMGVPLAFLMVFLCCLCTFLTSISVSAIATNGKLGNGGPYYLISRSLGPEMGAAVGLLFCLANTIAIGMYLIGGVEILLIYLLPPAATIGGLEVQGDTGFMGDATHNFRLYATGVLLVVFVVVILGVKFAQMFAPISLVCVLVAILSIYVGMVDKTFRPEMARNICMIDDMVIFRNAVIPLELYEEDNFCDYCVKNKSSLLYKNYCVNYHNGTHCQRFLASNLECVYSVPGLKSDALSNNSKAYYMKEGEAKKDTPAAASLEVPQDITTGFFVLLAIYFPSVTGIMTGCNISGDLKRPQKSIPLGTILAQISTSVVFLSLTVVFGASIRGEMLRDKYGFGSGGDMGAAVLCWPNKYVVLTGAFLSTFGAALQSLVCAPRLLQAIALDNVIPLLRPLSVVTKRNEPLRGQILLGVVGWLSIMIGKLDIVAPLVQNCFLVCYFGINLSCAAMSLLAMPSWRPKFRFYHPLASVLGVLLSMFLLFSTNLWFAFGIVFIGIAIYVAAVITGNSREWGDARRGTKMILADNILHRGPEYTPNHWPPKVLIACRTAGESNTRSLFRLAKFVGAPFTMALRLMLIDSSTVNRVAEDKTAVRKLLINIKKGEKLVAYTNCVVYTEPEEEGSMLETSMATTGLGRLYPNMLIAVLPKQNDSFWQACNSDKVNQSLLLLFRGDSMPPLKHLMTGNIDIWWVLQDGPLMLNLATTFRKHRRWKACSMRVYMVVVEGQDNDKQKSVAQQYLHKHAIPAELTLVILKSDQMTPYLTDRNDAAEAWKRHISAADASQDSTEEDEAAERSVLLPTDLNETMREESSNSSLVFVNAPPSPSCNDMEALGVYRRYLMTLTDGLSRSLIVRCSGNEEINTVK